MGPLACFGSRTAWNTFFHFAQFRSIGLRDVRAAGLWRLHGLGGKSPHAAVTPQRDKVRLINSGPSLLEELLRRSDVSAAVTTIILAGERLTRRLANTIFEAVPGVRLINCYGPTETTVYSTWAEVDRVDSLEPSIGQAIWNTTLYVLDSGRALVPPGAPGELFIGGAGVARGYLGRPDLTAERFIANPYGPNRLYRTGDRVRWQANGQLEYLERVDHQIKIYGVRVEPGEIEASLLSLPGVAAAVVMLQRDSDGVARLVAYLVKPRMGRRQRQMCVRPLNGNCRATWCPRILFGSTRCR